MQIAQNEFCGCWSDQRSDGEIKSNGKSVLACLSASLYNGKTAKDFNRKTGRLITIWEENMIEQLLALDGNILLWIQDHIRAEWLTPIVTTVTKLGGLGFIWIVLCLFLLCFKKTRQAGVAGLLALVFSLVINNAILKKLVARTRPYEVIEGLQLLTKKATDFSFPSGHSASAFAAATAICRTQRGSKWRWIVLAGAVCMALSRLYIGIHYPSDVICGALSGTLCGLAAAFLTKMCAKRFVKRF